MRDNGGWRADGSGGVAVVVGVVALGVLAELVAVLAATRRHFTYTLDDAYIHLTLAQQIAHGHYGLDPGVASSPSSSILWPFLLAPLSFLPHPDIWPLVLNAGFTVGTAVFLFHGLRRSMPGPAAAALTCLLVLGLNVVGIAFTGMEHSLQVLIASMVACGLLVVVDEEPVPRYLWVAIALGPLVRYELAAVSAAAALVLVASGHWRKAAVATATWVAGVAAFSAFLVLHDLDPLPSSILAKSHYGEDLSVHTLAKQVAVALDHPAFRLCLAIVLVDWAVRREWGRLHTFVSLVLLAHAVAGDFGWFGRYDVYLYVATTPLLVRFLSAWWARGRRAWLPVAVTAALAALAVTPLVEVTMHTPAGARDIWSQQAQTADFVREQWQRPVAVNDLGLVAYRGDQTVLDLGGLASQEARRARLADDGSAWMDDLVRRSGVGLVAIYTHWFESVPTSWTLVGRISGTPSVSSAQPSVDLYVVDPADASTVCDELLEFGRTTLSSWTHVSCLAPRS